MSDSPSGRGETRKVARKRQLPKAGAEGNHQAQKTSEQDLVRESVSKETGVHFEVVAPHPAFPLAVDRLEWFMRCRNKEEIANAPYLNAVWKERGVGIWLESLAIGDTIDWIELAYGDERAGESLSLDYSRFDDPAFQADFNQRFPIVLGRIRAYEEVAALVSKRDGVHLEIRRAGTKGVLVFTVAALVEAPKGSAPQSLGSAIEKNVGALREAYQEITHL